MKKLRTEHTDRLLELYYGGKLDGESKSIVQGWLLSDDNRLAKDVNMAMLFDRLVKENRRPDRYTRRSLAAIQAELGFTDRTPLRIPLARRTSFRIAIGTAATIAAVFLAGVLILPALRHSIDQPQIPGVTIATESGSTKEVSLPDGSVVKLKGATTIAHASDFVRNRRVWIDGEAYFTVVRDETHPFTVESGEVKVTVLGTEFNMRAAEADTYAEVALATGRIQVTAGSESVTLHPSEKATIDRNRHTIRLSAIDDGEMLRLRGGDLSLEDVTLDEAFRMIEGYYQVRIEVADDVPHVDGIVVKLDDDATLDKTLFFLQAVNPVFDYRIEGETVRITKRR